MSGWGPPMTCSSCHAQNPSDARFCSRCGESLQRARSASELRERRTVTALYCDVVDSVPLGERLDDEELHEIFRNYQALCARVLARYDAEIARHVGDAILAYFGYPRAHEDDARRAILSGLAIVDELRGRDFAISPGAPVRLAVRIGVHTGPVIVGEIGGDLRGQQVLGHTMNLAARLQSIAEPDSVTVSAETMDLVPGLFRSTCRGKIHLKGIQNDVDVWQVQEAVTSAVGAGATAADSEDLIGRESELRELVEVANLARSGSGQLALVEGEAGLGKSRVLQALKRRLRAEAWRQIDVSCSAYESNTALWPFLDLVSESVRAGDEPSTPEEAAARSLLLQWVERGREDSASAESPERFRRRTLDAVLAWVLAESQLGPVLLSMEDLHWADPTTRVDGPSARERHGSARSLRRNPPAFVYASVAARRCAAAGLPQPTLGIGNPHSRGGGGRKAAAVRSSFRDCGPLQRCPVVCGGVGKARRR